jgi:hypothetical protein
MGKVVVTRWGIAGEAESRHSQLSLDPRQAIDGEIRLTIV